MSSLDDNLYGCSRQFYIKQVLVANLYSSLFMLKGLLFILPVSLSMLSLKPFNI